MSDFDSRLTALEKKVEQIINYLYDMSGQANIDYQKHVEQSLSSSNSLPSNSRSEFEGNEFKESEFEDEYDTLSILKKVKLDKQ